MSLQSFLNLWNPCFQRRRQQIGTPVYFHRIYKTLCNYCWITATSWGHLDKFTLGISFCTPLIFFFFFAHVRVYLQSSGQKDTQGWKDWLVHRAWECLYREPWCWNATRYSRGNEPSRQIFTQWTGSTPILHTEFGWYLRTFGMVYCGDCST